MQCLEVLHKMSKIKSLIENKQGGHVGIVLSFVIFITFLIFIYSIVEPATRVERSKQKTLELLTPVLMEELTEDMTSVTVNLEKYEGSSDCINLPAVTGIFNMGSVAKNEKEGVIPSTLKDDDTTNVNWSKVNDGEVIKIFYSKEFESIETGLSGCDVLVKNVTFDYGLIRTNEYIFESKIISTLDSINNSREYYEELKTNLSIPLGDEFGFGFKDKDGNITQTQEREAMANIYVEEIPVQYICDEANINSGFLIIKVW